jgi:hypothetical protein
MRTKRFKSRKVKKRRTYKKRGGIYTFNGQQPTEPQDKYIKESEERAKFKRMIANGQKLIDEEKKEKIRAALRAKKAAEEAAAAAEAAEELRLQQESFLRSAYTNENENKQNMGLRAPEKIAQDAKKKSQNAKKQAKLLSTSGNPLHQGP